ncbi:MAG: hypothetical protein KKH68_10180 [Proteobacteria bacterium]|nr:hypothetical protein [Pseudomonadota bacterium]
MQIENRYNNILLYDSTISADDRLLNEWTIVNSPATCLQRSTEKNYELIVIFQKLRLLKERFAMVELCSILKQNRPTQHLPLLCLLPSKHRGLLEQLQNAGTEYAKFYNPVEPLSKAHLKSLLAKPSEDCRIGWILSGICPHINYFPISERQEIMYCGAYRNRLVLGSHRLIHVCETSNHKTCQYFKCPKFF